MRTKLRKHKDTWLGPHAQAQVKGRNDVRITTGYQTKRKGKLTRSDEHEISCTRSREEAGGILNDRSWAMPLVGAIT